MREHYIVPILEDVLHDMRDVKVFISADLSSGYWHIKLDEASNNLTTFQTCFDRYRWRQLLFGLNSAKKADGTILKNANVTIQDRKDTGKALEQFQDMKGIVIIADDLVGYGTNQEEYGRWLHKLLQKFRKGVKISPKKLEIGRDSITFMGYRIIKGCIVVDPERSESSLICQHQRHSAWSTMLENLSQTLQQS